MANPAPGVTVNVSAASGNPRNNAPTGTWFVIGTALGPSGIAFPVNSLSDFNTYFGQIVNGSITGRYSVTNTTGVPVSSTTLYDALDVYFREGGVTSYVSLVNAAGSTAATAAIYPYTTAYQTALSTPNVTFTPASTGTWAAHAATAAVPTDTIKGAALVMSYISGTLGTDLAYNAQITLNGQTIALSPVLSIRDDLVNWVNSLPAYQQIVKAAVAGGATSVLPSSTNVKVAVIFSGGTDAAVADTDIDAALTPFSDTYGQGQVSYPGCTTTLCYSKLTTHAQTYNRVAFLDGADVAGTDNSTAVIAAVKLLQSSNDSSYAAMFAPNIIVPGIITTNASNTTGTVFNRSVPPSALAAARVAYMDTYNDCNVPAAGSGPGASSYAIGLSFYYNATQRANLNNGGVNTIRLIPSLNQIAIYGFRSCAYDQNWVYLNNVRFRMQAIRDFTLISENFMFDEIDGRGQVFANLNGQLAGQCQAYWLRKSIYGTNPGDSFTVNTGPQVNNANTIAAGQINAQVNMRMSPFGEFVTINVTKYTSNATLPNYNS
jgi:hypothetical protein